MDRLAPDSDFNSLSLLDLLEAREAFHLHLMNKRNVVGTAVGRYLIRRDDPYPDKTHSPLGRQPQAAGQRKPPKRLNTSEVRYYSWPCVLVFVDHWADESQFASGRYNSSDYIPPTIYMPDGRKMPICVVEAPQVEEPLVSVTDMAFPDNLMGGGYPVVVEVQGETHLASVGCMVTDGHKVYALTNRHVAGEPGEHVSALVNGKLIDVGVSSKKQLTRELFQQVYTGWPGKDVFVNMDVGLIEINDKSQWTAQVYGIGPIGRMADLGVDNFSLRLVGCPVRAYGCASRQMAGQIHALFYRYKSAGGFEYVADFLIGPREGAPEPFRTAHGDSGTLWLMESGRELMPIAVQWGGQVFGGGAAQPYALATCLSTICNKLDVDVVRDWNIGLPEYWGAVGHYTIAAKAILGLPGNNLGTAMKANLANVTYDPAHISARDAKGLSKKHFVPLADVPDYVWKMGPCKQRERPNHFADMDQKNPQGKTLLELCQDKRNIDVKVWSDYYSSVGDSGRGLLPFRVWQIFDQMVKYVAAGDRKRFLCAAGVISHYVGDACQPLHISALHDGYENGKGKGVHGAYEDSMVNRFTADLEHNVDAKLAAWSPLNSGYGAACMVVALMQKTFSTIQPKDIVDAYVAVANESKSGIADALWHQFGEATIKLMSLGASALAHLWSEAWRLGDGDHTIGRKTTAISEEDLIAIYKGEYETGKFIPSYTLNQIGPVLNGAGGTPGPHGPKQHRSQREKAKATGRRRA